MCLMASVLAALLRQAELLGQDGGCGHAEESKTESTDIFNNLEIRS